MGVKTHKIVTVFQGTEGTEVIMEQMIRSWDTQISRSLTDRYSNWVFDALDDIDDNFLITDPTISGHPIVFASRGSMKMSGYSVEEVVGKNSRIFQGPGTSRRAVLEIGEAIREEAGVEVSLLNYRKDGTPIWILFRLCPVFSKEDGRVTHFIGVQVPIGRCSRRSSSCFGDGILLRSCRREVCLDLSGEVGRPSGLDSFVDSDNRGLEAEESCEASELEKQKAAAAVCNILSALTHCSELTGKVVCGKRCHPLGTVPLSSALNISLGRIKQSFVLTDPHLPDMPIVYASDAFLNLTGYSRQDVLWHNCRFLCGPDTDVEASSQMRECIQHQQPCTVRILNYKKDGTSFWNLLHISPVRNASGKIAFYVGVQIEESSEDEGQCLSPELRQLGTVGAVKVAVRSLSVGVGSSKS
ncbi:LOW QUALITY PROTEIN: protein TWIN LOV 1-like [Aristolochia californica]|uniref:LOW QUALITY PROTEIN: protein TWIN LOV 1-like n=1 Tax=Aristolochia californica TaxID=171875 RepID=UPI0035DE842B